VLYRDTTSATKVRALLRERHLAGLAISLEPLQLGMLESGEWVGLRLEGKHRIVAFKSRSRDVLRRLLKAVKLTHGGKRHE